MGNTSIFKMVLREYERDRAHARAEYEKRLSVIYSKIAAIKKIDEELSKSSIEITKKIINAGSDSKRLLKELKDKNNTLMNEKAVLLKKNGFPENYLTDIYTCNLCKDTGFIEADSSAKKCNCLKQRLISKYYDLSNLNNILKEENFDHFDIRYYGTAKDESVGVSPRANIETIYNTCIDFVKNFDTKFTNLLFYGKTGLGKTFLCNCIAKDILDAGFTVLYVTAPQFFKFLEEFRFNRDELEEPSEFINFIYSVDLLIVDDIGTEFSTVVTSSELFNIINTRLLEKRPTIFSTNLSPTDFEKQYSERIISRFFGSYKMLRFIGEDIRIQKKYGIQKG